MNRGHQAPAVVFCCAHPPAGQQHFPCDIVGHGAGKDLDRSGIGQEAVLHFGQFEVGVFGGKDHVAGQINLEAATDCCTIDRRDNRFQQAVILGDPGKLAWSVASILRVGAAMCSGRDILQIPSG